MLIQETTPQVRQFTLQQESTDPNYGACLWMTVTLDLDKYAMMAQSDQGDYSHTWSRTPNRESFLELMCRVEQEYLTRKISTACVFNLDESKRQTISVLYPSDVTTKLKRAIMSLDSPTEESFYRECGEILDEFKIEHDFETIQLVKDHPHGAIVFAQMFCDHLQPRLRAILKQEAHKDGNA